eukprot:CAMPEP_0197038566 /NCGR_PEP_ID=MMETSP1384-20130603/15480_1 /TAXON_ID=29189 /ORGANISM="Ammonia sp." /LENGTH=715 /DNA_ID=CAMNT_0042469017 /DNA_START=49 /DNA_END=2196 /DNA_ORIENTATION=-
MSKITTVGDRVKIKHKNKELLGLVKFVGEVKGKSGIQYGIELDKANTGENNGAHSGVIYFVSKQKKGVFVSKSAILKTNAKNNSNPRVTVGSKVKVAKFDCDGTIRFIGDTTFKAGLWYGIELDAAKGKNNGTVKSRCYFQCADKHGSFLKSTDFEPIAAAKKSKTSNADAVASSASSPSSSSPSSPRPSASDSDANRRKDIERVVNVLNGQGSPNTITSIIQSYDDKKEAEDMEWLKIIATLKSINDKLVAQQQPQQQEQSNAAVSNNSNDHNASNVDVEQYASQIKQLKSDQNRLQQQVDEAQTNRRSAEQQVSALQADKNRLEQELNSLRSQKQSLQQQLEAAQSQQSQSEESNSANTNELERRLKFETEEMKQKYESEIRTLSADKQRLEQQVAKLKASSNYTEPEPSEETSEEQEAKLSDQEKDEKIKQLQRENEQLSGAVRSKDEIVANAKEEIEKLKKEIRAMKEEEEKEEVQLGNLEKDRAKKLLEERVNELQKNTLSTPSTEKKKTISELLNESSKEDAVDIIHGMGVIKFEYDKKLKKDTYNLDLTNNAVLKRLTNAQRKQFMLLLAHCICDNSGQQKVEKVKLSNMGIDDKLFPDFMDVLIENIEHFEADELWLESNKIGDEGMKKLAVFLAKTPAKLEVIKMYNNKAIISTPVCNELLSAIEENGILQKFTFEWRLTQHRDRINKKLNANQDAKRKRKWAKKK